MILKQPKLPPKTPFQYTPKITPYQFKPFVTACGCGDIDPREHAYEYSQKTEGNYCDLACLCISEGIEYTDRQDIKDRFKVVSYG